MSALCSVLYFKLLVAEFLNCKAQGTGAHAWLPVHVLAFWT